MNIAIALAKSLLPGPARRSIRNLSEDLRDWFDTLALALWFMVMRRQWPQTVLYFGYAPGDDLLCTAVLRELRTRGNGPILMISDHRELFLGNEDPSYVHPLWRRYDRDGSTVTIGRLLARVRGGKFIRPEYAPPSDADRRRQPPRHVIAEMCAKAGVTGPVSIRPYMVLSTEEKDSAIWARNLIIIHTSGLSARHPAYNKEWYPERFCGVVDALKDEFQFVQVGSSKDPPLANVQDLRGRTSLRELAAILYNARLFVGLEGFVMHLARGVDCPAVIIFGGRSAPWQLGYVCNFNLYSAVSCAPCWRSNTCDIGRICMDDIAVTDVVAAIRQMMHSPRNPLAVETCTITPEGP